MILAFPFYFFVFHGMTDQRTENKRRAYREILRVFQNQEYKWEKINTNCDLINTPWGVRLCPPNPDPILDQKKINNK